MSTKSAQRVASRWSKKAIEFPETDEELKHMADFLASQVDSMDDASVAYASYVGNGVPGERQALISTLLPKLILSYRKRLVGWFEFALVKRSNLGGGGKHIKKLEEGLALFAEAIPDLVATGKPFKLSEYLPENEYLEPGMMDRVAQRAVRGVHDEAMKAGVIGTQRAAREMPLEVVRDPATNVWFVPSSMKTYDFKDALRALGFRWNVPLKRWETKRITPKIKEDLRVQEEKVAPPPPPPPLEASPSERRDRLRAWYFATWYPANADRLTKVFTDYARGKQTSYKVFFKKGPGGKPEVKFDRDINTAWEAVEELRYRYIGRQGRGPWLEVLDMFVELVNTTSTSQLPRIIDRINNLQHSNGLFMEHFPSSVKAWYEGFLNAKYSTPKPDELAKFIPDRDLRKLLIEIARSGHRPFGWAFEPPPAYDKMVKELATIGTEVNWREKGYPRYKGKAGVQPDRFDPNVQHGLDVLKRLHKQRESLLSTEIDSSQAYTQWEQDVVEWSQDYELARQQAAKLMSAQRQKELEDPSHAADWEAKNFPEEFLEQFPWSVPGVSKSELAPYLTRYAMNARS